MVKTFTILIAFTGVAACGGPKPKDPTSAPDDVAHHGATTTPPKPEKPEPFERGASPADVVAPYVRPERSSRLASALPKGRARESWSLALDPTIDPAFIVTAGTRVLVQGRHGAFVLLDTHGRQVATGALDGDLVRLAPAAGTFYALGDRDVQHAWSLADGTRVPDDLPQDDPRAERGGRASRAATHEGMRVFFDEGRVNIGATSTSERRTVVEPPVQPLDGSIDDDANLHVIVRQDKDLALWTTPLAGGSVGRIRLGPLRRERADVPPILGKTVRVIVLDDRMVAIAQDGKTRWERKGALTGGATITSDDRLLVATDAKLLAIDPSGRTSELASAPKEIFITPPIVTGAGLVLVASGATLHAYAFE